MRKLLLITIACLFCIACGVKSNPEYKSQGSHIKTIHLV